MAFLYLFCVPDSRFEPHGVHFGPLEVDFRHLVVDVGHLWDDFKLLEVDFSFGANLGYFWPVGFAL